MCKRGLENVASRENVVVIGSYSRKVHIFVIEVACEMCI